MNRPSRALNEDVANYGVLAWLAYGFGVKDRVQNVFHLAILRVEFIDYAYGKELRLLLSRVVSLPFHVVAEKDQEGDLLHSLSIFKRMR